MRDQSAQVFRRTGLHSDTNDPAPATLLQQHFEFADQVFGFFLDLDVAVADHTEQAAVFLLKPGKEFIDEHADDIFQRNEAQIALGAFGQANETPHKGRQWNDAYMGISIPLGDQIDRNRKAQIRNERERMRGIDCEWCQDREDV